MSFTVGGSTPQLTFADATVQNTAFTGLNQSATPFTTSLGYQALNSNTGVNNTAVGYQAAYSNTTALNNTAFGYQAGYSNTTGTLNVFIGSGAGYSNTTTNSNIFIGSGVSGSFFPAGYYNTTGTQNTYIGGGGNMTTGSKNTILGNYSGNQGGLDIRTASNNIVLSDGDGNPRMYASSAEDGAIYSPAGAYNSARAVTVSALNTNYAIYNFAANAIIYFRDNTIGGSAAYLWDPNNGLVTIASNLSGKTLTFSQSGGVTYVRQTAGSVPTNYTYNSLGA